MGRGDRGGCEFSDLLTGRERCGVTGDNCLADIDREALADRTSNGPVVGLDAGYAGRNPAV